MGYWEPLVLLVPRARELQDLLDQKETRGLLARQGQAETLEQLARLVLIVRLLVPQVLLELTQLFQALLGLLVQVG